MQTGVAADLHSSYKMASYDTTEELPHVKEEELEYYARQLQRSGKYNVTRHMAQPSQHDTRTVFPQPYRTPQAFTSTPLPSNTLQSEDLPPLRPPPPPPRRYIPEVSYPHLYGETFTYGATPIGSTPRIPKLPQFSGEGQKGDCEFDVWKYDINCLLHSGVYPQHILLEAIRSSLRGKARSVLLHLGELAGVSDIIAELEAIYGNVATTEKLKEQFYMAKQLPNETVADYSLRLEQLLQHSSLQVDFQTKNEMLRNRLWSGLRDRELKNAARFKFETLRGFNSLRKQRL